MTDESKDTPDSLKKENFNEERIRLWREQRLASAEKATLERQKKAELERELRVQQFRTQRQEDIERSTKEEKELVLQKLPNFEKINEARQTILLENQRKKKLFFTKIMTLILISGLLTLVLSFFTTPFYEAESIVTIKTNSLKDNTPGSAILPTAVSSNIIQHIFSAREYIFSRGMMDRMEREQSYMSYFKKNDTHYLSKPFSISLFGQDEYNYYKRRVKVALDIQEGLLRIKVQAKNPKDAKYFADALLRYAEEWVNSLSNRMFADKIKEAESTLAQRKISLKNARENIVNFQISNRDLNPRATTAALYKQLDEIKAKIKQVEREIGLYAKANVTNSPVVERLRANLSILHQQRKSLNAVLVDNGTRSMNRVLSGFESALIVKEVAEKEWEVALNSLELIKSEVFNQRQYFLTIVPPISTMQPAEPNLLKFFFLILIVLYCSLALISLLKTTLNISVKT